MPHEDCPEKPADRAAPLSDFGALNIAGLSIAFTAFLVIMMQVRHEYGFDRWIPQSDCVFRVEQGYDGKYQTLLCNPLINELKTVSAHIRAAALVRGGDDC